MVSSHPIQYFTPWFRHLATILDLEVLYAHRQEAKGQNAAGFGIDFEWDIPLLEGYNYRWLKNVAPTPGLNSFEGCDTPELFELIGGGAYDALLVLGWNRKTFLQALRAAKQNKVTVLCRGDSQLETERSILKRMVKFFPYRMWLPRFSAHLYVGKRNKKYLQHYGVSENNLFFCPHFVDTTFFAKEAQAARKSGADQRVREQFKIPTDALVAVFVGKLISKKRASDLIAALLKANQNHPNIHALIVGDGPLKTQLENMARPCANRIHFAGFRNQSELPRYYAASDILVLPSNSEETWGLVVNEAMACDLPAIVSDVTGCAADLIDSGLTGWTYPVGDVAKLLELLINYQKLNSAALRRKCEEYSLMRATSGLLQGIEWSMRNFENQR